MAGILKVVVPYLGEAFSGQLVAANIPLYGLVLHAVPVVEMVLGITLHQDTERDGLDKGN